MSIDFKRQAASKMAEQHVVQEELLREAQINFKDDCKRYDRYIEDLQEKTAIV